MIREVATRCLLAPSFALALVACGADIGPFSPATGSTTGSVGSGTGGTGGTSSSTGGAGGTGGREVACRPAGDYDATVMRNGVTHRYRVHVPSARTTPTSAVMLLHGGGSNAAGMDAASGMTALADEKGFVVILPEGYEVPGGGGAQVWNGGNCCGPTALLPDHVAALEAVLDDTLAADPCLEPKRVYATGHSNGGIMTYRLACELSDRFAAVAVSAGYLATDDLDVMPPQSIYGCAPIRPVPLLHVHGLQDQCVPYGGGLSNATGNTSRPVETEVATWRMLNGCSEPGIDETTGEVRRRTWSCAAGSTVELITVDGLGHAWAGASVYGSPQLCGGTTTMAVSTTAEAWRFFQAHPMP